MPPTDAPGGQCAAACCAGCGAPGRVAVLEAAVLDLQALVQRLDAQVEALSRAEAARLTAAYAAAKRSARERRQALSRHAAVEAARLAMGAST